MTWIYVLFTEVNDRGSRLLNFLKSGKFFFAIVKNRLWVNLMKPKPWYTSEKERFEFETFTLQNVATCRDMICCLRLSVKGSSDHEWFLHLTCQLSWVWRRIVITCRMFDVYVGNLPTIGVADLRNQLNNGWWNVAHYFVNPLRLTPECTR